MQIQFYQYFSELMQNTKVSMFSIRLVAYTFKVYLTFFSKIIYTTWTKFEDNIDFKQILYARALSNQAKAASPVLM